MDYLRWCKQNGMVLDPKNGYGDPTYNIGGMSTNGAMKGRSIFQE